MELSTGPDIRWEVRLANGKSHKGSRNKVLTEAVVAWLKNGVAVHQWIAPGTTEKTRQARRELIQKEYEQKISEPEDKK